MILLFKCLGQVIAAKDLIIQQKDSYSFIRVIKSSERPSDKLKLLTKMKVKNQLKNLMTLKNFWLISIKMQD
jgi:hypothetical protein